VQSDSEVVVIVADFDDQSEEEVAIDSWTTKPRDLIAYDKKEGGKVISFIEGLDK
jgi:hypothetical protein